MFTVFSHYLMCYLVLYNSIYIHCIAIFKPFLVKPYVAVSSSCKTISQKFLYLVFCQI